jgi:hypothetical protein
MVFVNTLSSYLVNSHPHYLGACHHPYRHHYNPHSHLHDLQVNVSEIENDLVTYFDLGILKVNGISL